MPETKSEAFHRLATARIEVVEDKIRIFSNLSGANYEWTQAEVMEYLYRIEAATLAAVDRFAENTKRWPVEETEPENETIESIVDADEDDVTPEAIEILRKKAEPYLKKHGKLTEILQELGPNEEAQLEMIDMQREVIKNLQAQLDELRAKHPPAEFGKKKTSKSEQSLAEDIEEEYV